MSYYFTDVKKFHDKFNLTVINEFKNLPPDLLNFRVKFLEEEYQEYVDSCMVGDLAIAIDSLIDLVYITCGTAIHHGIQPAEWDKIIVDEDDLFNIENSCFLTTEEPLRLKPSFLSAAVNVGFTYHLRRLIRDYCIEASRGMNKQQLDMVESSSYQTSEPPRPEEIKRLLGALYASILAGATYMGISNQCWNEMWDNVQTANMSKERVKRPEDSKRGSAFDVIKPKGWLAPDSEGILAKYTA